MTKYFGTDGIRGKAGKELGFDISARCGMALGKLLRDGARVLIGKDTRVSGDMIEYSLAAALAANGAEVTLMGVAATPAVAAVTAINKFDIGIMVSASHNPPEFNGIKVFGHDGYKLSDRQEEEIEELMSGLSFDKEKSAVQGRIFCRPELAGVYVDAIKKLPVGDLTGLKVCLDCANGASCSAAGKLFGMFGCEPVIVAGEGKGELINVGCGSMHPQRVAEEVVKSGADCGFCFDGDADRIIAVDSCGRIVDGDGLLYIAAKKLMAEGALKGGAIVGTVMTNLGLEQALGRMGLDLIRTPVGDKYVIEEMRAKGCNLGGESSGHIIFGDYATTGDGVLTALIAASVLSGSGSMDKCLDGYSESAQTLINIEKTPKRSAKLLSKEYADLEAGILSEYAKNIRLVVRPSGTEPVIRVMAESGDKNISAKAARLIADFLNYC